jgi:hypothetical protein
MPQNTLVSDQMSLYDENNCIPRCVTGGTWKTTGERMVIRRPPGQEVFEKLKYLFVFLPHFGEKQVCNTHAKAVLLC